MSNGCPIVLDRELCKAFAVVICQRENPGSTAKNHSVNRAIGAIADDAWTPVHYPGAVTDPDTGELIGSSPDRVGLPGCRTGLRLLASVGS